MCRGLGGLHDAAEEAGDIVRELADRAGYRGRQLRNGCAQALQRMRHHRKRRVHKVSDRGPELEN